MEDILPKQHSPRRWQATGVELTKPKPIKFRKRDYELARRLKLPIPEICRLALARAVALKLTTMTEK